MARFLSLIKTGVAESKGVEGGKVRRGVAGVSKKATEWRTEGVLGGWLRCCAGVCGVDGACWKNNDRPGARGSERARCLVPPLSTPLASRDCVESVLLVLILESDWPDTSSQWRWRPEETWSDFLKENKEKGTHSRDRVNNLNQERLWNLINSNVFFIKFEMCWGEKT